MGFPKLQVASWKETRTTVQQYTKVISAVRRALTPNTKHGWRLSLFVTARGFSTPPLLHKDKTVDFEFDFFNHELHIRTNVGEEDVISLDGQSVKEFQDELIEILQVFGIDPEITFSEELADDSPLTYDDVAVENFWQALSRINAYFEHFKAGLREETSQVQFWPHGFDLSLMWLSGRQIPGGDPADAEKSDEQMTFGFSSGDHIIPEPYFYATAYPQPSDLPEMSLPPGAFWQKDGFNGAVLLYATFIDADDPKSTLIDFLTRVQREGSAQMADAAQ
ncbi:MAG: DUF5996 family protein [Chloroflexota bacterium]